MKVVRLAKCSPVPREGMAFSAALGMKHLDPLGRELGSGRGQLLVVDLAGIKAATASYLKATVVALLRSGMRSTDPSVTDTRPIDVYPVVANLCPEVAEEFGHLLTSANIRLPFLEAIAFDVREECLRSARLIGFCEQSVRESVRRLSGRDAPVTAQQLMEENPGGVRVETAWNNRLAELHRLRLARRVKDGRFWRYSLISREVNVDG